MELKQVGLNEWQVAGTAKEIADFRQFVDVLADSQYRFGVNPSAMLPNDDPLEVGRGTTDDDPTIVTENVIILPPSA